MATRKEREEVDKLLRSMGAQPQMVKQTREAAKGARFRNRAKQMQYQALRELARKRNIGQLKDALSGEAKRLMDEQAAKGAPAKDKRNQLEKDADATRAEFQRDAVKAVRRAQREKPERERKAKAKAQAEAKRKAEKQKKARKLAQQDKATMMMERQRKRGEMSRLESRFDASEGKKRVGKSRRLTKRQMELLKGDPKARARLEKMAGKGIVSKGTRRKTGPRQEEDLEAFLNQPSMRKGKPAPARKGKGRKAAPAKTTGDVKRNYRAEAERNTRMAADPKNRGKLRPSERTPRFPTGRSGMSRSEFLAMSKAKQNKALKENMTADQWDRWQEAGIDLAKESAWELIGTVLTGGLGLGASVLRRGLVKLAREAGEAGVKQGTKKVAKDAAERKARQKTRDAADFKRKARNAKAREKRRQAREAKERAEREAREKAEREAKERARKDRRNERARQRRREQREQREREQKQSKSGSGTKGKTGGTKGKTGGRKTGTGSSGGRKTGNTGRQQSSRNKDYKQDWQREKERRGARGGNPRQQAGWRKKAREWTKKAKDMTEEELRKIYDRLNLARDRGPSSSHGLEALKQYIAEAIREGAPI